MGVAQPESRGTVFLSQPVLEFVTLTSYYNYEQTAQL